MEIKTVTDGKLWGIGSWWKNLCRERGKRVVAQGSDGLYRVFLTSNMEGHPLGVFGSREGAEEFARGHEDVEHLLALVRELREEKDRSERALEHLRTPSA